MMQETVVIIPSFNPDEKLLRLLESLREAGLSNLLIVNDGSRPDCAPYFKQARQMGATVLTHAVNMGKGRALKTAFNYVLNTYGDEVRGVCADADGQHAAKDIRACLDALEAHPDSIVMGCRQFDDKSIPFRSRFGNKLTRQVFRLLCGVRVSDTQTGLRALTGSTMRLFLTTRGERFEYEMNMLIETKEKDIPLTEVPIRTIYIEENQTSHFNPLRDSLRIYAVFVKFIASSLTSFLVDFFLFWLLSWLFEPLMGQTASIFLATAAARVLSSLLNYSINKRRVFGVREGRTSTLVRYYILCAIQMLCSAGLVDLLAFLTHLEGVVVKIPVDLILFLLSFQIQREWVFRTPRKSTPKHRRSE